ncbi:MAG: hypothetical protein IPL40_09895 [Proteobacteria bacterium]|nr:hypothetical protein [Pseudomonadota bacterium]
MLREHELNSRWWGEPVGIVDRLDWIELPARERERQLRAFAWVELKAPLHGALPLAALRRAGFYQVDTQLHFRIALEGLRRTTSAAELVVEAADRAPFRLEAEALARFEHERFSVLPGMTAARLSERYALWGNRLITAQPADCLRVSSRAGQVQGWFLAARRATQIDLTLAMLSREATVSGYLLYQLALASYAERGARIGAASFQASNTAVHNIYASLGARFVRPTGCWFWVRGGARPACSCNEGEGQ